MRRLTFFKSYHKADCTVNDPSDSGVLSKILLNLPRLNSANHWHSNSLELNPSLPWNVLSRSSTAPSMYALNWWPLAWYRSFCIANAGRE